MASLRPTTAARTCSRISRRSTCPASRPSRRARKSASTWCRGPRASRPPTSRIRGKRCAKAMKGRSGGLFLLEVVLQLQAEAVDGARRLEQQELRPRRGGRRGPHLLRLAEAIAVVVADQAPARGEAVAGMRIETDLALRLQLLVLVEAELVQVGVLRHVERQLQAAAAEKAARGARVDIEAQSQEHDGVVLALVRKDVALPVVMPQPAEELKADRLREAVDPLHLVDQPGIARARRDGLPREEEGAGVIHRAAAELAAVGPLPARRPLVRITPAQAVARTLFRDARRAGLVPLETLEIGAHRPAGMGCGACYTQSNAGENPHYMRSII